MNTLQLLKSIAADNGGIIETKLAAQQGISRSVLSRMCKDGEIHRIVSGQYVLPQDAQDELLSIAKRSDHAVFSHETALYLGGISALAPSVCSVTVPSGSKPSSFIRSKCKVYYIKPELLELGKVMLTSPAGNPVPAYDMERTVCDIVRSRNKLEQETFLSALKLYAASPKKDLGRLELYAEKLHVAGILKQYLSVLL